MKVLGDFRAAPAVRAAFAFSAIVAVAAFAPAASASPAFANDLLLCISDTDFGCFGSSAGNAVSLYWNGSGSISTATNGSGTITSDGLLTGDTGMTVDASLGAFMLNVATGAYDPSPGTAMDLNSIDITSSGPATLYLVFGADNYTGKGPYSELGSVTLNPGVASATDTACYEPGSGGFFACGQTSAPLIGSRTATSTGALSFGSTVLPPSTTFGLEEDVKVSFTSGGTFSGDLSMVSTPEPATTVLIGAGLLGLGLLKRKRVPPGERK